ncbi:TonB-dependent siderophore receptor [Roseateles violae]|uniref:TonB-dependent receptor n=1 Tax=Roseateles violae TaxID=3058042 RepID=A0ABT8DYX0_9BURK|nr:TonB-dependent receptor [Pelomonas sp. PFR6]MDN3922786.1 TonB-dependent receptor [Pelomonas sp. PFR6]
MAIQRSLPSPSLLALAAGLLCAAAQAQTLPTVSVSGRSAETPVLVGGFGDVPVAKLPMQAAVLSGERLLDLGINSLAGIVSLDASIGDAYNSQGYVSYLKIRGFDLDNRFNYRRDGLPINAETVLPLTNKSAVEVLKGTSGVQAGTSAPGGLVNLQVKRPQAGNFTSVGLFYNERGTVEGTLDWNQRLSPSLGLRVNASAAHLDPLLHDAKGNRHLLAAAVDWQAGAATRLEAEFEVSHQSQPSQPGFSLLGDTLPSAKSIDPRVNLNNQDWSQPVVFDGQNASLRLTQQLDADWKAQAHLGVQRLQNDDRLAYPFGCTAADGSYYADRYCPNGDFDMYDFRSENEHRDSDALDLSLAGKFTTAGLRHDFGAGLLLSRFKSRFQRQAYNWAGTGNISGIPRATPDPSLTDENTNRDESSRELYLRDAIQLGADWQAWLGLRHSWLERDSVRTDGSRATHYKQDFTTPWLGLSYALSPQLMAYASWGEGIESTVVPNRSRYTNAGQALPALRSEQFELGLKAGSNTVDWSINVFDITRPLWRDIGSCDVAASCTTTADGEARHRGIEAQADLKWQGGGLLASAIKLRARREGSADPALNGLTPPNTPETTLKLLARQGVLPGLQLQTGLVYEGPRPVLPDNSVAIPGWTRLDAGARYDQVWGGQLLIWRVGVDNLADRRAWKESPFQYEHVYLYPLAPRTWRASLEIQL